jgi:hypothetical protein
VAHGVVSQVQHTNDPLFQGVPLSFKVRVLATLRHPSTHTRALILFGPKRARTYHLVQVVRYHSWTVSDAPAFGQHLECIARSVDDGYPPLVHSLSVITAVELYTCRRTHWDWLTHDLVQVGDGDQAQGAAHVGRAVSSGVCLHRTRQDHPPELPRPKPPASRTRACSRCPASLHPDLPRAAFPVCCRPPRMHLPAWPCYQGTWPRPWPGC